MAGISSKTTPMSLRLPVKIMAQLDAYAAENDLNRSQAAIALIRLGLDKSEQRPATSAEVAALRAEMQASFHVLARTVEHQPIAIQEAPATKALDAPKKAKKAKKSGKKR